MSILIVEDDDHKLSDVEKCLLKLGFLGNITNTRSVRDGGIFLRKNIVDLIILDMSLPNFDPLISGSGGTARPQGGLEILEDLRHRQNKTPVVTVSYTHLTLPTILLV